MELEHQENNIWDVESTDWDYIVIAQGRSWILDESLPGPESGIESPSMRNFPAHMFSHHHRKALPLDA